MEVKYKEPINISSLIFSMLTLVIGLLLCFYDFNTISKFLGYGVGGVLCLTGVIRIIMAYFAHRKTNVPVVGTIIGCLVLIALGIFILIFPDVIMKAFSLIVGILVTFIGIQRLILGITVRVIDRKGSIFFICESVLMILLGLVIMTNQWISWLGAFLVVYAITELVGYIYYTTQNKDYSSVLNKKITKEMKESEAKDAIIEED